jgi:hypothetical protein
METIQNINNGFEIIGNDPKLNRAIEKAQGEVQIFQYWLREKVRW